MCKYSQVNSLEHPLSAHTFWQLFTLDWPSLGINMSVGIECPSTVCLKDNKMSSMPLRKDWKSCQCTYMVKFFICSQKLMPNTTIMCVIHPYSVWHGKSAVQEHLHSLWGSNWIVVQMWCPTCVTQSACAEKLPRGTCSELSCCFSNTQILGRCKLIVPHTEQVEAVQSVFCDSMWQ